MPAKLNSSHGRRTCRGIRSLAPLLAAIVVALVPLIASASIRLPLNGYCRPGRCFPIEIDQLGPIRFTADGAIPTDVAVTSSGRSIVPMLVLANPGELRWPGGSLPLRVPGEHERLVAFASDKTDAGDLFPGDRVLPIHLDAADPLPGPAVAWGALDAIVFDSGTISRITAGQRSVLLAAGVTLAVCGPTKPDKLWPWKRHGSLWVLTYTPAGPVDQLINVDAYAPTFAWSPGWSKTIRMQIAAAAVLLFLAIVALSLLRNRRAVFGIIALSLGSAGAVSLWQRELGSAITAGGDVIVQSSGLIQRDAWVFERGRLTSDPIVPWTGWTVPIFGSPDAAAGMRMRIQLGVDGKLCFGFHLERGKTIAFVRREVQPGSMPVVTDVNTSPMRESARAIYLTKGDRIMGETAGTGDRWPGTAVGRKDE